MALSNEEINHIQKSANIVDVIGSYINLEKKGKNYFGICPFHDDHNPSMSVSEEKGIFTCFVCHKTGNVFTFVQDYENISFLQAVKKVADRVGIKVDANIKENSKYDKHYEAMDLALKFYQNELRTTLGKSAREYLNKRGLNDDVINEFEIGFAPNKGDILTKLLISKGFSQNVLLETGLSAQGNTLYDLFRNRITFPIHDKDGRAVGFSARIYEDVDEAKYINTRETPIFKKGEILFNYHRAFNEARRVKSLIIVEGQMDAIRVYSNGIKNVVATMGTALTKDHIKLLKRLNVKIVLCFDNDDAGEKATLTNGDALSNDGIDICVLRLSGAKDPDEYILKYGADKYVDAVNHSISFFDFKINYLKKNKDLTNEYDASNYINSILNELSKSNDEVLIDLMVNKINKEYGIDKNILINKIVKPKEVKVIKVEESKKKRLSRKQKLCELLLFYMMNDVKYIKLFNQELSYIPDTDYQKVAEDILAFYIKYNYISIADFITNEVMSENYELVNKIIDDNISIDLIDNEFVGIIEKIKIWINEDKISELKEKMKNTSDINEKLNIMNLIASYKKKDV